LIPQAFITEWGDTVPWQTNEQVEQDLIICRALVEIFKSDFLASHLAFRGGTALHKIYLLPQPRYSEDIDLVQVRSEPIKETIIHLRKALSFLGKSNVVQKKDNNSIYYSFESEFAPVQNLKLKIETNCREHFTVLGWEKKWFEVKSSWFEGGCNLNTYKIEELLGTKLRALYQRKKGRDLFDLWRALHSNHNQYNPDLIVKCYKQYILLNLEKKMFDKDFLGDTIALLRPDEKYNHEVAFQLVRETLIERL
jgi:predicted nucleotidyltransferase component of viral defense system